MDAVHDLELLTVFLGHTVEVGGERLGQGGGDVLAVAPGPLGHVGPPAQRPVGLVEDIEGVGEETVVGEGEAGRPALAEPLQGAEGLVEVEVGGGVDGRSTPASGSLTPTASPTKSTPLSESCRPT